MSAKANPTTVGVFVIGAVVLAVVVVLVFGSGTFFGEKERYVVFFSESVNGLSVGAPVKMRGVKIGEVRSIRALFDEAGNVHIEVLIESLVNVVEATGTFLEHASQKESLDYLVQKQGLRAQLALQSIVLGQLYVNIDYFPGTKAVFTHLNDKYYEVPSIPQSSAIQADIERLVDVIVDLPLEETVARLNRFLAHADTAVMGVDLAGLVARAESTLGELEELTGTLDRRLGPTTESLMETSESARATLARADTLFAQLIEISAERDDELAVTLRDLQEAARAFAELTDYLQRHPSSLIWGKD